MINRNTQQKRIQVRGLSYVPSSRITKDGGCSESLNLQCDDGGDIIPMMKPVDADLGLPAEGVDGEVIFIHKQPSYTNVIAYHEGEESCTVLAYSGGTAVAIDNPTIAFVPKSCTSVGNTIILSGDPFVDGGTGVAYFVYKNGNYKFLGNEIPSPVMKFAPETMATAEYIDWLENLSEDEQREKSIGQINFLDDAGRYIAYLPIWNQAVTSSDPDYERYGKKVIQNKLYRFSNWSYAPKYEVNDEYVRSIVDKIWAQAEEVINYNSIRGILNMPVFVRYAIRLYDGTSYSVSIPILIAPWGEENDDSTKDVIRLHLKSHRWSLDGASSTMATTTAYFLTAQYEFLLNYYLKVKFVDTGVLEGWDDLVESVDIFVSRMVTPYPDKTRIRVGEDLVVTPQANPNPDEPDYDDAYQCLARLDPWGLDDIKEQEKNILGYSNFYLVKSYSLDEFKELVAGEWISLQDDLNMDPDHLSVLEALKEEDAFQSGHRLLSFDSASYNKRLLAWNAVQRLSAGYRFAHASSVSPEEGSYRIWYHINTGEGVERVVYGGQITDEIWDSWIAYPDSRCEKATLQWMDSGGSTFTGTVKMKQHPSLNIAYAFYGLVEKVRPGILLKPMGIDILSSIGEDGRITTGTRGQRVAVYDVSSLTPDPNTGLITLTVMGSGDLNAAVASVLDRNAGVLEVYDYGTTETVTRTLELPSNSKYLQLMGFEPEGTPECYTTGVEPTENNIEYITGQLLQSEFANPWSFPAAGRISVGNDDILGVGIIAKPISSGQFGQFDLYVFTEEGIWTLSSDSEGHLTSPKMMSRDVAYPGSIATLDQSIAFITDKGVMMLAGGDIVCASESLYGKSDTPSWLPDTLRNAMGSEWVGEIASQMENQEPFMNFIKGGRIAYDYAGRRLLVYNPGHPFMYVYMLTANTWHRMDASAVAGTPVNALNSYPDCDIVCSDGTTGYRRIWDFSTFLHEVEGQETLPGVFVTRPLNLESIDVYKSIQHLLIRYETDPSSVVKYLLLASDDLRTWRVMHSLKGPSHKYYRIAVIASLVPGDRIDYIELDFLNKFNWRLR